MIRQISVFLENRAGQLAELTGCLAAEGIDLRALNIAETSDYGMLRMIVADPEKALVCLEKEGFLAHLSTGVAISVDDKPGALAKVLSVLEKESIDISYMYSIFSKLAGKAYMVIKVADPEKAEKVLKESGVTIPDNGELDLL